MSTSINIPGLDIEKLLRELIEHPGERVADVLSEEEFTVIRNYIDVIRVTRARAALRAAITNARRPNPSAPGPDAAAWYDAHTDAIEKALADFETTMIQSIRMRP